MVSVGMPIANDDQETFKDIGPTNNVIHAPKSEKGTSSTPAKPPTMTRVSTWTTNSACSNPKAIPNRTFLSVSAKTPPSDSSIEELSDENRRQKLYHETLQRTQHSSTRNHPESTSIPSRRRREYITLTIRLISNESAPIQKAPAKGRHGPFMARLLSAKVTWTKRWGKTNG